MIVWEYAGGGNQWLMTQYDLPSYYIKSATGKYMTETADGSDISMNAEASDAAKWKLTGGDTDYDYTFTSPSGNLLLAQRPFLQAMLPYLMYAVQPLQTAVIR
jgi:hypothetical protein